MYSFVNRETFKVRVDKPDVPEGLEYATIPVYKCYNIIAQMFDKVNLTPVPK